MTIRFGQMELPRVSPEDARVSAANKKLKGVKERARRRGGHAVDAAVEYFVSVLRDSNAMRGDRMRAAENLCDRFGFPRQSSVEMAPEAFSGQKYLIVKDFPAPSTFNPEPPPAEMQSAVGDGGDPEAQGGADVSE